MWKVLGSYGIRGKLFKGVQSFYVNSRACVRVDGDKSDWFDVRVGLRQGCVMSPWMFNLYMDNVLKEMELNMGEIGVQMRAPNGRMWRIWRLLFADDTALVAESVEDLQRLKMGWAECADAEV